jgi:hypothetical protein
MNTMKEILNKIELELEELKTIENELGTQLDILEDTLDNLVKTVVESSNKKEKKTTYIEWVKKVNRKRELERVKHGLLYYINNNNEE